MRKGKEVKGKRHIKEGKTKKKEKKNEEDNNSLEVIR